jgi:chorismate mutase
LKAILIPDNAWSDAKQQITPEKFAEMLDALVWRLKIQMRKNSLTALATLREQINHLDDELMTDIGAAYEDR